MDVNNRPSNIIRMNPANNPGRINNSQPLGNPNNNSGRINSNQTFVNPAAKMDFGLIMNEIRKVINGKDDIIEKVLMCIIANGHVVFEDRPGVGKTTLVKTFVAALGLKSSRIQFTNDLLPSDITGYVTYDITKKENVLKKGPVFDTNILLADEINRASAKTQSALLEIMEERQATLNNQTYKMCDPFIVMGTMNPYNSPLFGVNLLPQSQLDRFMISLSVGYADKSSEVNMLKNRERIDPLSRVRKVCTEEQLLRARQAVKEVHVDDSIYRYIIELCSRTRTNEDIEMGISPRGELAITNLAKARAYFKGRDYVTPADVQNIFVDASIHRITLKNNELTIISNKRRAILEQILRTVSKPSLIKRV